MSTERSHGKVRFARPRSRDAVRMPQAADREPTPAASRPHRAAKRALTATVTAALNVAVGSLGSDDSAAPTGAQLAQRTLTLYRSARRELGTDSPMALSHLIRWATQTIAAQRLNALAIAAGLETAEGERLLSLAAVAEGRAERASVAAMTTASALRPQRRRKRSVLDRIEADAEKP